MVVNIIWHRNTRVIRNRGREHGEEGFGSSHVILTGAVECCGEHWSKLGGAYGMHANTLLVFNTPATNTLTVPAISLPQSMTH